MYISNDVDYSVISVALSSKHGALSRCCFNVVPSSMTLKQHCLDALCLQGSGKK